MGAVPGKPLGVSCLPSTAYSASRLYRSDLISEIQLQFNGGLKELCTQFQADSFLIYNHARVLFISGKRF